MVDAAEQVMKWRIMAKLMPDFTLGTILACSAEEASRRVMVIGGLRPDDFYVVNVGPALPSGEKEEPR